MKTVKTLLQGETGFPPCQQELTGFRSGGSPIYHVSDRRRLSELNLPKENVLYLNTPPPEGKKWGLPKSLAPKFRIIVEWYNLIH